MKPKALTAKLLITALTLLFAVVTYAQNSKLMLNFGGSPGDPLAHSYDYGLPEGAGETYTMRIPVLYEDLDAVIHDTVITIKSDGKIVQRVDAERAYKSLGDCNKGLAVVKEKLKSALPVEDTADDAHWQFLAEDRKAAAIAVCEKRSKIPFFTLRLEIAIPE